MHFQWELIPSGPSLATSCLAEGWVTHGPLRHATGAGVGCAAPPKPAVTRPLVPHRKPVPDLIQALKKPCCSLQGNERVQCAERKVSRCPPGPALALHFPVPDVSRCLQLASPWHQCWVSPLKGEMGGKSLWGN